MYERALSIYADMVIEEAIKAGRYALIDMALDNKDREAFMYYTSVLKGLKHGDMGVCK